MFLKNKDNNSLLFGVFRQTNVHLLEVIGVVFEKAVSS